MSFETFGQPLLTFPDAEKSPLSIRAKALVFVDPRSRQLREELEQLAPRSTSVLIRGETGTGKELLARHIHRASDRSGLFVSVNCGAISPTYADAELFGYAAGSHNGSASSRAGWFGSANGGTLYLDEIGDLPLPIQTKLLAALENHEVTRVGAQHPSPVDVRLVAATSIDLAQAVAQHPERGPDSLTGWKFGASFHIAIFELFFSSCRDSRGRVFIAVFFSGNH